MSIQSTSSSGPTHSAEFQAASAAKAPKTTSATEEKTVDVSSMNKLKETSPELYDALTEGIVMEINKQCQASDKRRKELAKAYEQQ